MTFDDPSSKPPIYVTRPSLPELDDFIPYLREIWDRRVLTNGGPVHERLERELCDYLGVKHLSLFCNGTVALVVALQALRITGEVITTPFSFVATAHSLLWNGIEPVFVDIDPHTLNLDPRHIEAAITPRTTAIMPVHVYGQPCDVEAIEAIAKSRGLRVIYDAAHAFGVRCHCGSVLEHGDLSVLSFHATKVFNTFEGGAIVSPSAEMKRRVDHLKNFGFVDETTVTEPGINGKMNELQAAVGLLQLQQVDRLIDERRAIDTLYREGLAREPGLRCLPPPACERWNYSYFPIFIGPEFRCSRDELYARLRAAGIWARRYFYPLIPEFPMYRDRPSADLSRLPVARRAASEVLCLPIYPGLAAADLDRIVHHIRKG